MAYGFGSGINPSLGATNYSGYLQGALAGAQMEAQGAAAIGQGIANVGQQLGQAIQQYQQNKTLANTQIGKFESAVQNGLINVQQLPENIGKAAKKLLEGGNVGLKDAALLGAYAESSAKDSILALQLQQQQEQTQSAEYAALVNRFGEGNIPSPYAANAYPATARMAGTNMALDQALKRTQIGKATAQKDVVGRVVTEDEFNRYKDAGLDVDGVPNPDGSITLTKIGSFTPPPTTNINVGEKTELTETAKAKVERNVKLLTAAQSGMDSMRKASELKNLIETGDVNTGIFAPIKQGIDRFVAGFGGQEAIKRASATELASALMGSEVFQLFQQLGVGARGLDTPAERDFMIKVLTGDVTMQKEAILNMAKRRFDEGRRDVEKFNSQVSGSEGYRNWVKEYNYDIPEYVPLEWGSSSSGPRIISVEEIK